MHNPILIYGINLGELDENRRLHLSEIFIEDEEEFSGRKVDEEKLEQIVNKQGLNILKDIEDIYSYDPELENLYVGIKIKTKYVESMYGEGVHVFDIEQICRLRENPSELIEKMKSIGIDAKKTDLRLYRVAEIE